MADFDFHGAEYGDAAESRLGEAARRFGAANIVGAATSIALAGGLAVWAVDLTMRDVSGVPVIAALDGPMRVAPENPGGMRAPFQGMALSELTSGGPAAPAPEEIVLAPAPVDLDAPALAARRELARAAPLDPVTDALAEATPPPPAIAVPAPEAVATLAEPLALPEPLDMPEALDLAESVDAADGADLTEALDLAQAEPAEDPLEAALAEALAMPEPELGALVQAAATGPGIVRSPRPPQRPLALRRAPTEAPIQQPGTRVASLGGTVVTSSPNPVDADPASLTVGTRVVQLGAFDSEEIARQEWTRLSGKFAAYMGGKKRLVQKARSGGRDFWRLRVVGFQDGSDARRFCSALLAKDAACIPVTIR